MTEADGERLIAELHALLDRERQALLDGDLRGIGALMEEKAALVEELAGGATEDTEKLAPLHLKFRRNQELFDQALAGIRNVAERLGTLREMRRSMNVYDSSGRRETIESTAEKRLEKRA